MELTVVAGRCLVLIFLLTATASSRAVAQGDPLRRQRNPKMSVPWAADVRLQPRDDFFMPNRSRRSIKHDSWTYIDPPEPPRVVKVHDIITIIVDEKFEVTSNSRFTRSRQATLKAELKEFIRIGKRRNLRPAAQDSQPTIDTNLNGRFNGTGQQTDQEGIRYRIAATVVDILPNGNIVLEARKTIRINRDVWSHTLTGILPANAVLPNNTALSDNIANLLIARDKTGKVNDSVRLPWGARLVDIFFPF
jgi:flagellar L-ring protein precursor FlgH